MLTYVINTSENKSFDSEKLFDLAGYSKIRWISCSLTDIRACADSIYEKQNVLGADQFRIAVIVDFYSFDRIRLPYGRRGFVEDKGVDMSLYMPYIEIYLLDNLIGYLEKKDLCTADFEIYYVQNEKGEQYELLDSALSQVRQILNGDELAYTRTEIHEVDPKEEIPEEGRPPLNEELEENRDVRPPQKEKISVEVSYYRTFKLHCTPDVELSFNLVDYPYGASEMSYLQFWEAFRRRTFLKNGIRRHYYITPYGAGASRTAFDTLSLSLYLIRMYEREEMTTTAGDMEVIHLRAEVLRDVLEKAWCKVNVAQESLKNNNTLYYSLSQNYALETNRSPEDTVKMEDAIYREKLALPKDVTQTKMGAEELYDEVCSFYYRNAAEAKRRNRAEFDSIMQSYLRKRDENRENNVEEDFNSLRDLGLLKMTDQSPSKKEYDYLVEERQREISRVFEQILAAEYIEVDYSEEKERADDALIEYRKAKACMHSNIIGDIIFMLLAIASMVIPYATLQLSSFTTTTVSAWILGLLAAGIFGGLFVCSVIFQLIPLRRKLSRAKVKLLNCYINCNAKEKYSFSSLRRRYEKDLIYIEQLRYEIRQLKRLYDANRVKDQNVDAHRMMLEEVEDCISTMLNNMDVEPVRDPYESVEGEFDVNKPIRARENKIYQVFSIEAIENMFPKKGGDE